MIFVYQGHMRSALLAQRMWSSLVCMTESQMSITNSDHHKEEHNGQRQSQHGGGRHDREESRLGALRRDSSETVMNMAIHTPPSTLSTGPLSVAGAPQTDPDPAREIDHVARASEDSDIDQDNSANQERSVRLSVNLSVESAETLRALIRRKGLTITEGIRRSIAVWKFVEDETSKGNQIAVIEHDGSIRKVVLL